MDADFVPVEFFVFRLNFNSVVAGFLNFEDSAPRFRKKAVSPDSMKVLNQGATMQGSGIRVHRVRVVHRLKGHDYGWPGFYFVTICTARRERVFGRVVRGSMIHTWGGALALRFWKEIPDHFPHVHADEFIVMPDHVHGIIEIIPLVPRVPCRRRVFGRQPAGSLSIVIGSYKSIVTREVNRWRGTPGAPLWQASYYDRIIHDVDAIETVRAYIRNNPAHW